MSNLRRLSLVLAVSVLFNVGLTALWLRARRAAILPSVAKVTLREGKTASPTVDVQFTTDMPTDEVDPSNPPVLFTPPVAGKSVYAWQGPRLLAVSLDDSVLTPGRTYQTRARDGLQDARGLVVDARPRPFVSPALRLTGPIEVERVSENSTRLVLPFNGLVFPRNLASKTTLSYMWQDKPASSTTSTVQAEYAHRAILMVNHPPGLKEATVKIVAKLKAKDADIGTPEAIEQAIELVPHLRFTRAWCPSQNSRELSIRFSTTTRLKQEGLSERIEISPPAKVNIATGYRGLTLSGGDLKPRTFYRITFRKGIQGLLSTVLEEDTTFTVITGRFSPSLEFLSSGPLLPRSRKAELLARLSSVEEATFTAWRVYPRNYVEYFRRDWHSRYSSGRHVSYGTQLRSVTFKPEMEGGKQEVRTVPLDELLQGQTTGLFVIEGEAGDGDTRDRRRVILTDIGLGVVQDRNSILVWALSLADGTPLADCQIDIYTDKNLPIGSARTDRNGTARITHGNLPKGEALYLVTARLGDDTSMLLLDGSGDHNQVPFALKGRPYPKHAYEAFVYTERGICRPGERIIAAAFVRDDARLRSAADLPVELRVRDPLGRVLQRIPRTLNADGFATARFEIPFDARTGGYSIQVAMPGGGPVWGDTRFTVGCYRPDQIRTTFEVDKSQYEIPKEKITATLDGRFYFGPPASDCQTSFRWEFTQRPFRPKGYEDYTFGDEQRAAIRSTGDRAKAKTDDKGRAQLVFLPKPDELPAAAWGLGLTAELVAPSGATVSARRNATLHVYPFYLGLKRLWKKEETPKGNVLRFGWTAVSPAGKEVAPGEKVLCLLQRHEYIYMLRERSHGFVREWAEQWTPVARGEVPNSVTGTGGTFTVPAPRAGSYRLTITGKDNVSSSTQFWYSAGDAEFARPASPTALLLETDKPAYAPGETAMVSFHSPMAGQALLCLSGKTALRTVPVAVQAGRNVVPLALPGTVPYASLFVSATVVCPFKDGHDAARRLFGLGRITLVQDTRRLDVALDVPATARPNGQLPVTIRLRSGDAPSRGTVQLLAVDEGVLALTAYRTPDPFAHFFGPRSCSLTFADAYNQVFTDLSKEYGDASPIGGGAGIDAFFNPVAAQEVKEAVVLARLVHVDESGEAQLTLQLPEHTGALRLMAIASSELQVGVADQEVQVHHPLALQLSAPRAVAPGDQFQAVASVFNTELPETDVVLRFVAEGTVKLAGDATARVRLKKGQRQVIHIPLTALTDQAGQGTLRVEAIAGDHRQQARAELSCRPASPPVYLARFWVQPVGKTETVQAPDGILPGTGNCELQVSADPALELAPALSWLLRYDYGCLEQTLSRAVPLVALRELSTQLLLPNLPNSKDGGEWQVRQALLRLSALEQPYGGYGSWPGTSRLWVGGSVYACHFLYEAKRAGYPVDRDMLRRAQIFLRRLVEEFHRYPEASGTERAYALYLLAALGEPEPGVAQGIAEDAKTDPYARFLAAAALVRGGQGGKGARILRRLFATDYLWPDGCTTFDSLPRRAGLALAILADAMPDSPECVRLAEFLRQHRNAQGHWGNTQANAMAVWGLSRWLHAQGNAVGKGVVTVAGKQAEVVPGKPFRLTLTDPKQMVGVATTGGQLYISWQQRGVPLQAPTEDVAQSLQFRRQYLDEDGNETTTFAQGDLIRVRLTFSSASTINRFVLADVLPGGVEVEDGSLVTRSSEKTTRTGLQPDVIEKRDDRLVLSGRLYQHSAKNPGIYEYHVRAVTPGQFAIPRLVAENMYNPAQRAETGSGTLTIRPVP